MKLNSEVREHGLWTGRAFYWFFIFLVMFGVAGTIVYATKPVWLGFERRAFVASPQYVESKRTELLQLAAEVRQIDTRLTTASPSTQNALNLQRDVLIQRMEGSVALIPSDAIPESVRMMLR